MYFFLNVVTSVHLLSQAPKPTRACGKLSIPWEHHCCGWCYEGGCSRMRKTFKSGRPHIHIYWWKCPRVNMTSQRRPKTWSLTIITTFVEGHEHEIGIVWRKASLPDVQSWRLCLSWSWTCSWSRHKWSAKAPCRDLAFNSHQSEHLFMSSPHIGARTGVNWR